jgi:phosphatase NudJ
MTQGGAVGRDPIPTWFFVLVVVRSGDQFLVVQETKHGQLWYLPAGRVEPGEDLVAAAERETLEEAGVLVRVDGIVRFEHTPDACGVARLRVVFTAVPVGDTPPKSIPDDESLEARWVTREELDSLPLRSDEVREIVTYVEAGGLILPMSFLTREPR